MTQFADEIILRAYRRNLAPVRQLGANHSVHTARAGLNLPAYWRACTPAPGVISPAASGAEQGLVRALYAELSGDCQVAGFFSSASKGLGWTSTLNL